MANSKPEFHYQAKSGVVGDLDLLPAQLWQLAANLRLIDRGFSADAECPCGCLPHDPPSKRQAAGCTCWDGFDVNTASVINQRLELMENRQAEQHAEHIKALRDLTKALREQTAALSRDIYAVNANVTARNGA